MATRIRLQRHGKKSKAFFHIVAADSKAKRDGKFIEKLGVYNPNTNPATIDINFDRTLYWVQTGAEMSDTARAILSYKGVLYKNHLVKGVAKGALTDAQVEERFNKWLGEKENKIQSKLSGLELSKEKERAERAKAEADVATQRAAAIEAKNAPEPEVVAEAPVAEEVVAETPAEEVVADAPVAEEVVAETPAEEVVADAPVAEEVVVETPAEEVVADAPVAEEVVAEIPAEEATPEEAAPEADASEEESDKA